MGFISYSSILWLVILFDNCWRLFSCCLAVSSSWQDECCASFLEFLNHDRKTIFSGSQIYTKWQWKWVLCMSKFFQEQGILHEISCVHTPQQNGRVERKHRHILEVARALHFSRSISHWVLGWMCTTATYLINSTPSQVLHGKTPFEILYGHAPFYKHIRVFGCLAYAHNLDHKRDKFESWSHRCIFVGYLYGKKGWRLYDIEREIFFVSRDAVFNEAIFPLKESNHVPLTSTNIDTFPPSVPIDTSLSDSYLIDTIIRLNKLQLRVFLVRSFHNRLKQSLLLHPITLLKYHLSLMILLKC